MSKLTKCEVCGKDIAKGVKCIHCGHDQRNFFMKHKIITVILGLVLLSVIGLGTGNKNSTPENNNSASNTDTKKEEVKEDEVKKNEIKEFYAVNEDVKLGDAIVKVTKVEKSYGGEYDKPKDGMEYVIVTVSIKNVGKGEISYNPYDFRMQNSKGQITHRTYISSGENTDLESGFLASGGEVSGTIAFEQPRDDKGLVLKYNGNLFSIKDVKIKLN